MSQQRRNYLIGGLIGIFLVGFLFYRVFLAPLQQLNAELDRAQTESEAKEAELFAFLKEKKSFARYRFLGLPLGVDEGVTKYTKYLRDAFEETGTPRKAVDIDAPSESDTRVQVAKKGQPGHIVRTYQVRAKISWPRLLAFLTRFQETPLLQRIKSFNIERPSSTASDDRALNVSMAIETLTVARGDPKAPARPENLWGVEPRVLALDALAGLTRAPTGWALVLRAQGILPPKRPPLRQYADLGARDPFFGPAPVVVVKKEEKKPDEAPKPKAPSIDVREFVRFVGYDAVQAGSNAAEPRAYLRNLLITPATRKDAYIALSARPPMDVFRVFDEARENLVVKGKVLRIDQRDVYFQVEGAVYAIHIGQDLSEAMRTPLTPAQVDALGLQKLLSPLEKGGKAGKIGTGEQ